MKSQDRSLSSAAPGVIRAFLGSQQALAECSPTAGSKLDAKAVTRNTSDKIFVSRSLQALEEVRLLSKRLQDQDGLSGLWFTPLSHGKNCP